MIVDWFLHYREKLLQLCQDLKIVMLQGSVSRTVDSHHPRRGLPDGLSDCQILGPCGQFPSPPCSAREDATAVVGLHGVSGMVCSQGLCLDVPFSMAAEGPLVSSCRQASSASSSVAGSVECVHCWLQEERWASGVHLQVPPPFLLYTDTSWTGWGTHLCNLTATGKWPQEEMSLHINILEMKAVQLALNAILDQLVGESVVLMSGNATVMAYPWKPGGHCLKDVV